jgi:voltage-gated potassium channel
MEGSASTWARPGLSAVGLLLAYYAVPVSWDSSTAAIVASLALTSGGTKGHSDRVVVMMLLLVIVGFSMTFYLTELSDPDQLAGLRTRTDALYFTLSTMATVGYGDVHATGQVARAVVCALIAFTAVVVAALVRTRTRLGAGR